MTLNSSGPLSFGGGTTGQSINLELGVSATATASINSTSFRTLAGVASGQISVSNFYGKSNSYGFALYIGVYSPATAGGYSGTNYGSGLCLDSQSNIYWTYFQTSGVTTTASLVKANSSGVTQTYVYPFNGAAIEFSCWQMGYYASAGVVIQPPTSNRTPTLYGSSLNRIYPANISPQYGYSTQNGAVNSAGEVLVGARLNTNPPYQYKNGLIKLNSAGTTLTVYSFDGANNQTSHGLLLRSDGSFVIYAYTGSYVTVYPFAANLTMSTNWQYSISLSQQTSSLCIDTSNNIFVGSEADRIIMRLNSSYDPTHRVRVDISGSGNTFTTYAMKAYGSTLYVFAHDSSYAYVIALSASTLDIQWINRFAPGGSLSAGRQGIAVGAQGVYFVLAISGDPNSAFICNIPLTGVPSNSSKSIGGGVTLTWTIMSGSVVAQSLPTKVSQGTQSLTLTTNQSITNTAGTSPAVPVNVKTIFP